MKNDPGEHDDPDTDPAEIEAEAAASHFDTDPDIYAGTDDDGGFCDE